MASIFPLEQIRVVDQSWAGEKAARLAELRNAGFNVPAGICLSAQACVDSFAASQTDTKISQRLSVAEIDDPVELEAAAEEIREWIEHLTFPPGLVAELDAAIDALATSSSLFAIRVSRVFEDVVDPRASGLDQAYLAIRREGILDHVRRAWATPWTSRAIYYRHRKKMDQRRVAVAVLIQPMIPADAAGVMFTCNPLNGSPNEIHIDATFGLGEAIVAARWRPDHFVVDKARMETVSREVAIKGVMEIASPEGLQTVAVPLEQQEMASLSDGQVLALAALGKQIEANYSQFRDIEWCRVGDKLFVLQARPLRAK